ncbi:hypothetical protein M409DRAFT_30877 [Zasmidium cellare ATCC 36951]|uniref:Ecp2 effector protein domain-containing protein n=1 Tax=Zasmidium cellare ATCC 36951 TaxID=1080233 RepID=A0A6A6BUX9_ZASCE|nr:uncharacterized protein M409DRAFT_30877 [Zasmidium cellare ATCC 36951]KAF2158597.1 hypothetical protein M409DRAFT_30877 [Zasmidium cellare ATCC 36951]
MMFKPTALLAAVLLATIGISAQALDSALSARDPQPYTGCDNIGVAQQETDTAVNNLGYYGNYSTLNYYSCDCDTVAFFCIWKSGPMLNSTAMNNVLAHVTTQCGPYQAGSSSDGPNDNRTYSYGYTNWRNKDYCNVPAGTRITASNQVHNA